MPKTQLSSAFPHARYFINLQRQGHVKAHVLSHSLNFRIQVLRIAGRTAPHCSPIEHKDNA